MNCFFNPRTNRCIYCGFYTPNINAKRNCPANRNIEPVKDKSITCKWISNDRRVKDIYKLASLLPHDVTAVAGIPRSGLGPAMLLAEILNLHSYVIHPDCGLKKLPSGWRFRKAKKDNGKLVIIDDTIASGRSIKAINGVLPYIFRSYMIAVIYCSPANVRLTDVYVEKLPTPHYLEWNFFNSIHSKDLAVDFDGILCRDNSILPRYLPRKYPLKMICTGRLEKNRRRSEIWLRKYGVQYGDLKMYNHDIMGSDKDIASFKSHEFIKSSAKIFVESDPSQAEIISKCGKRVICPDIEKVWN